MSQLWKTRPENERIENTAYIEFASADGGGLGYGSCSYIKNSRGRYLGAGVISEEVRHYGHGASLYAKYGGYFNSTESGVFFPEFARKWPFKLIEASIGEVHG